MLRSSLRNRRGSILVMVALMLVALMIVTAIVLDIGRFYVVTNEMHTALDAAALSGAQVIQHSTAHTEGALRDEVQNHVLAFVSANYRVDNEGYTVFRDSVRLAYWEEGYTEPEFDYAAMSPPKWPNAVSVRWRTDPPVLFAGIFGQSSPRIWRRSVAWVSNLNSGNCVRPWGLPYHALYNRVNGTSYTDTQVAPDLTQAAVADFSTRSRNDRMIVMLPGPTVTSPHPYDGRWKPFSYASATGGNPNAGRPGYVKGIQDCYQYKLNTSADNGVTLPANANDYVNYLNWAESGNPSAVDSLCKYKSNTDAGCYEDRTTTTIGKQTKVAWGDFHGTGSNQIRFRVIGEVELVCYFRGTTENNTHVCNHGNPNIPTSGHPRGTIIVVASGIAFGYIQPEDDWGSEIGTEQRILLVK